MPVPAGAFRVASAELDLPATEGYMGKLHEAVKSAAADLAGKGLDIGVVPALLPAEIPFVMVIFASPAAIAWANSLGVDLDVECPGSALARPQVDRLMQKATQAGLKVGLEVTDPASRNLGVEN